MEAVGDSLRRAGVVAIYLVHGTFFGSDSFGLLANLACVAPQLADTLRGWNKQLVDTVARDLGNFTPDYAETWQRVINPPGTTPIPVRLFHWSSENHHLGRADGAVRLVHELVSRRFAPEDRVLLVCHSHGGNVAALATNLLVSERDVREAFFQAASCSFRGRFFRRRADQTWDSLRRLACANDNAGWPRFCLDIVTLGTPVRYGWETGGCDHLLHIINHHPCQGLAQYQARFPPNRDDLWFDRAGDFVQQIGIAGTNLIPPLWAVRSFQAELRLGRMLQTDDSPIDLLTRLRRGVRTHADGDNLLVDYGPTGSSPAQHLFGHAVYTRKDWLLFHAELIAQRLYQTSETSEVKP